MNSSFLLHLCKLPLACTLATAAQAQTTLTYSDHEPDGNMRSPARQHQAAGEGVGAAGGGLIFLPFESPKP